MGRALVYTGTRYGRGRRQKTVRESWYVGANAFKFVSIAAVAVLMGLYVSNSARNNQNNAVLQDLNQQRDALSNQLDSLKVEEARNANAAKTKDAADKMGLVQNAPQVDVGQK